MEAQWASKSQSREARRSRRRTVDRVESRRAGTRAAEWDRAESRQQACAACGELDEVANQYHGASGLVCAACFSRGDGELTVAEDAGVLRRVLLPMVYTPLLFPLPFWVAWGHVPGAGMGWWMDAGMLAWHTLCLASVVYTPALLVVLAADTRTRFGGEEDTDRWIRFAGHTWHALALIGMQAVAWALLLLG